VRELNDRRARKKAQTRELIRTVAHRMFAQRGFDAVTIADIAREADVAVQTVFNHFATKEELFFDGRTPWVDGAAEAIRTRKPGIPPLTALRAHLVDTVRALVASHGSPERRCYVQTLEASEGLRVQERELVHETARRVRAALLEAWAEESAEDAPASPTDPDTAASLIASVWLAAARSLVVGQRSRLTEGADPEATAAAAMDLADRTLRELQTGIEAMHGQLQPVDCTDTGWPQTAIPEAG
jgi:AcrR family transcriptional regulator